MTNDHLRNTQSGRTVVGPGALTDTGKLRAQQRSITTCEGCSVPESLDNFKREVATQLGYLSGKIESIERMVERGIDRALEKAARNGSDFPRKTTSGEYRQRQGDVEIKVGEKARLRGGNKVVLIVAILSASACVAYVGGKTVEARARPAATK
jgi:hypothetical protein